MLKLVDKFVKEGKYEDALKVLAQARETHPANAYTLAYEERILSLLNAKRRYLIQHPAAQTSDQLNGFAEVQQKTIDNYLSVARQLRNLGEYENALDQLTQAFLLGPPSPELVQLEEQLWRDREIALQRAAERNKRLNGEKAVSGARPEPPRPAAAETAPIEHDRLILTRLQRAHQLLESGEIDKALEEISAARNVDPWDQQVRDMELLLLNKQEKIRIVAERNRRLEEEAKRRAQEDEQAAGMNDIPALSPAGGAELRDASLPSADTYYARAQELTHAQRYDEASLEAALGLIVDPHHSALVRLKEELLSVSKQKAAAAAKKSSRQSRKRVSDYMKAAHASLASNDFESALASITAAYELDPQNKELRKLEMVVRREELLKDGLDNTSVTGITQ